MARKYLGDAFDIHGGGVDLRFPHHENEQAQSRAAGHPFASYWMHNAWITTAGEKMSKSLGNSLLIPEVLKRVRGIELRYYLVAAHYRSHVEFSFEALDEAAAGFQRIENFLDRAGEARPSWVADRGSVAVVERICRRLDGLPLAIELAAARLRVLEVEQIADGLDDCLRMLAAPGAGLAERHRTLQATLDFSHDLLPPAEAAALA